MSTHKVLQQVLSQSLRFSSRRVFSISPVRNSFIANTGVTASVFSNSGNVFSRYYNTQVPPQSDIFKVVDFKDIRNIIKQEGKGYDLIDVREEKEVIQGAIPTAKNIPLSQFANALALSENDFESQYGFEKPKKESQVILYCLGGVRSTRAAEHLSTLGYKNLQNYIGSWADYAQKLKEGQHE